MTFEDSLYQFGPFHLDPVAGILYRGADPIVLGQRAVALMRRLLESEGMPVSWFVLLRNFPEWSRDG